MSKFYLSDNGKTLKRLTKKGGNPFNLIYRDSRGGFIVPEGVEKIERRTFANCEWLTEITLPTTLKEMGEESFLGCTKLTHIEIPEGLKVIPDCCFKGCQKLSSVSFPDSIEEICDSAFSGCGLETIVLGSSVKRIGDDAFCSNGAKSLQIGASSKISLGERAFWYNDLQTILIDSDNAVWTDAGCNVIMEKETGRVLCGTAYSTIPEGAKAIATCAFRETPKVMIIPSSVETIETAAFCFCKCIVLLQEGVEELEWGAFQPSWCGEIIVYLPSSLSEMEGQYSTVDFRLDAGNPYFTYDVEGNNIISDMGELVWGRLLKGIPNDVSDISVVYKSYPDYEELVIPGTVATVSPDLFRFHSGLKAISIYKGTRTWANDEKTTCTINVVEPHFHNIIFTFPAGTPMEKIPSALKEDS